MRLRSTFGKLGDAIKSQGNAVKNKINAAPAWVKTEWGKLPLRWQTSVKIALVLGVVYFILTVAFVYAAIPLRPWLELVNGATWPDNPEGLHASNAKLFASLLALRTLLNLGALVAIFVVLLEVLFLKRVAIMKIVDLMKSRDVITGNEIAKEMELSPDNRRKIDEALRAGGERWAREHLPILIGKDAADRLFRGGPIRLDSARGLAKWILCG